MNALYESSVPIPIVRFPVPHEGRAPFFFPAYPPAHTIAVHCSTIHVDSALVLLQARRYTRPACRLEVMFHDTSSLALKRFRVESGPAMITVTQGTAAQLEALARAGARYYRFLKVPPGLLRWTSPEAKPVLSLAEIRSMTLVHIDHPTDLAAVHHFRRFVGGRVGVELEAQSLDGVPENRDQYRGTRFYLTNSFMDRWALCGNEPAAIPGWAHREDRYLYVNGALCDLVDGRGRSIALFLQEYLAGRFGELSDVRRNVFTDFQKVGGPEYLQAGALYLGLP